MPSILLPKLISCCGGTDLRPYLNTTTSKKKNSTALSTISQRISHVDVFSVNSTIVIDWPIQVKWRKKSMGIEQR